MQKSLKYRAGLSVVSRVFMVSAVFAALGTVGLADAPPPRPILNQNKIGTMACGPCSVINAMAWGNEALRKRLAALPGDSLAEKAKGLIKEYGGKDSKSYDDRPRYTAKGGMTWVDMPGFMNDALNRTAKPVVGNYLDRQSKETLPAHLRRVHRQLKQSIDAGMPVITSLRSFTPVLNKEKNLHEWWGLLGHWVTIVRVDNKLDERAKGFSFSYVDPGTGKLEHGYAWYDEARNFTAAKGDEKNWQWLSDRSFLLITAPSLRLHTQNQPWYLRTIITLNYVVRAKP